MQKEFDDTNWKQEILGSLEFNQTKFASKLLKNGAKSYMQSIYLGYLYTRWKKLKGYDKFDPKPNNGQLQSSFLAFENSLKWSNRENEGLYKHNYSDPYIDKTTS